jgi:predicted glutamine amidotransferase
MCRWITLISAESYSLSDVVLAPSNSLIQLSRDASFHPDFTDANNATMNGDGFGIGKSRGLRRKKGRSTFLYC